MGQQLKNAHWGLRENNNCASVLFYGNFFLISIEKKIANALRIKRERQKGKQLFSSLQGKKYSAEKRRPNLSQKCNSLSPMMLVHILHLWVQVQY